MKTHLYRVLAASALLPIAAFAAPPTELYSPALPAMSTQTQECRVVNVSGSTQDVTSQAFMSNGVPSSGPVTQTLAHGEAGGFAFPGYYASMYCKFTVKGASASGFRASIDVFDANTGTLVIALPAY